MRCLGFSMILWMALVAVIVIALPTPVAELALANYTIVLSPINPSHWNNIFPLSDLPIDLRAVATNHPGDSNSIDHNEKGSKNYRLTCDPKDMGKAHLGAFRKQVKQLREDNADTILSPGYCTRLTCGGKTQIMWCNYSDMVYTVPKWSIGEGATYVYNKCPKHFERDNTFVSGIVNHDAKFSVLVIADDHPC
ncbi:hypothetical protein BJX64DRAFT_287472 [Aspergillus heterothallicus]